MHEQGRITAGLGRLASGLNPMNSLTFIVALGATALAGWNWYHTPGDSHPPFPAYGAVAASYVGGFLIGRVFRTLARAVAFGIVLVLGGLGLLKSIHVDTTEMRQTVEAGSQRIHEQAGRISDDLMALLPSGGAAGAGMFAGGRRRRLKVGMT